VSLRKKPTVELLPRTNISQPAGGVYMGFGSESEPHISVQKIARAWQGPPLPRDGSGIPTSGSESAVWSGA